MKAKQSGAFNNGICEGGRSGIVSSPSSMWAIPRRCVLAAPLGIENKFVLRILDRDVVILSPRDAKSQRVVSKFCDGEVGFFLVVAYLQLCSCDVGDHTLWFERLVGNVSRFVS